MLPDVVGQLRLCSLAQHAMLQSPILLIWTRSGCWMGQSRSSSLANTLILFHPTDTCSLEQPMHALWMIERGGTITFMFTCACVTTYCAVTVTVHLHIVKSAVIFAKK